MAAHDYPENHWGKKATIGVLDLQGGVY